MKREVKAAEGTALALRASEERFRASDLRASVSAFSADLAYDDGVLLDLLTVREKPGMMKESKLKTL